MDGKKLLKKNSPKFFKFLIENNACELFLEHATVDEHEAYDKSTNALSGAFMWQEPHVTYWAQLDEAWRKEI